ncbi:MAG: murein hydrolase activator EnvC family protein, partial [Alphaproteobacteria bacterium]
MRAAERALLLAAALVVAVAGAATAQSPETRLRRLERQAEEQRHRERLLLQDRDGLQRALAALQEEAVAAVEAQAAAAARVEAARGRRDALAPLEATLAGEAQAARARLARLAAALERLARTPREALLLQAQAPVDALRAGRLLAHAVPAVDAHARAIAVALDDHRAAREAIAREEEALAAALATQEAGRARLEEMIARRGRLVAALDAERMSVAMRLDALGREMGSLRELLERLAQRRADEERARAAAAAAAEQEREAPARARQAVVVARPFAVAGGRARPPAAGRLVANWGQADASGTASRGMAFEAAPGATIVSPWQGTVAYAGPFRGYGVILIVDSGDGYHWFVTGFGRRDVAPGRPVGG